MAIPVNFDPKQGIYMVKISMGSPHQVDKSREIDSYKREITYKKSKEVRKEIGAIRQRVNERRAFSCAPFFGAYFTNQIGKDQLITICQTEDRAMKEIDPALHVTAQFIKQNFADNENISAFDQMLGAIRSNILRVVLDRIMVEINREKDHVTPKTRKALISMCEKARAGLNITQDPSIDADIQNMIDRINADEIRELRDEILIILDDTKDRAASLEIVGDIKIQKEPAKIQPKNLLPDNKITLDLL